MKVLHEFKSWWIWKFKFEFILLLVVLAAVTTIMSVTAQLSTMDAVNEATVAEAKETWLYQLVINGSEVGYIDSAVVGEESLSQAMMNVKNILGYDPKLNPEIRFYEIKNTNQMVLSKEETTVAIEAALIDGIDIIREQAYVMKIGTDFKVAVASIEEAEAVLQAAEDKFLSGDRKFVVTLTAKAYNSLVLTPLIHEIYVEADEEREFLTSAENRFVPDGIIEELEKEDIFIEEDAVIDPMYHGETTAVAFSEDVVVAESYVDPSDIVSVEEAIGLITKENEEPKTYEVAKGDCPSVIADSHNMSLSVLYSLNQGLEEDPTRLQIGDELIVMVPEPELSVTTYEVVVYNTSIARGSTYVENGDKFVGHTATIDNGYDGVLQVTATLTKINGKEASRSITDELILTEPKNRVIEKGTKPLPSKGATGSFIPPTVNYTITSKFGYRWGGFHYGVDMAVPTGSLVRASDGGVVTYAGWMGDYGYLVIIDHGDGITTRYGHNSKIVVTVGQYVSQYEKVAASGNTGRSTGPHIHFEIRFDGIAANPLDYLEYQ